MVNFLNVKYAGKPVNERKDFSQFKFCSQKCVRQNISQKTIEKAKQIYGDNWQIHWKTYQSLVIKLSDFSYKKFKNIINPNNYERKRGKFHLDHIIPKIYRISK